MARQLEQKKEAGLINTQGQGGGTSCRLSSCQQTALGEQLAQQDFWTLAQIQSLIDEQFQCHYSDSGLRRLLKRMQLYHYKPQPRDYRQSPHATCQLTTTLKAVADGVALRGESWSDFAIGFADEFAPQLQHNRARLGSVYKEKTRPLNSTRLSQSTFGFYAVQGQSVVEFPPDGKAGSFLDLLRSVKAANVQARRIVLLWDNARVHLDRSVQALGWQLGIYLVALPPYSPNLNPIERIWKSIRYELSQIGLIESASCLRTHIQASFERLSRRRSFATKWLDQFLKPIYELSSISG